MKAIPYVYSFVSDQGEQLWYVRGKTLNRNTCGKIFRKQREIQSPYEAPCAQNCDVNNNNYRCRNMNIANRNKYNRNQIYGNARHQNQNA